MGKKKVPPQGKKKKNIQVLWIVLLFLLVLILAPAAWMRKTYAPWILSRDAAASHKADAVLVLGAGVYQDGSPTPMLRERVEEGCSLYFKGAGKKLLLSGDHGQITHDEVSAMKALALEAGVPEEDIFLDHAGFCTWDSLWRAKEIFGAEDLCVVSQRYHLYRAMYLADALGLKARGVPSDTREYRGQFGRDVREVLASDKAVLWALFSPGAEIQGPPIDLQGDGRATWD